MSDNISASWSEQINAVRLIIRENLNRGRNDLSHLLDLVISIWAMSIAMSILISGSSNPFYFWGFILVAVGVIMYTRIPKKQEQFAENHMWSNMKDPWD
jgi:hypothetical protein